MKASEVSSVFNSWKMLKNHRRDGEWINQNTKWAKFFVVFKNVSFSHQFVFLVCSAVYSSSTELCEPRVCRGQHWVSVSSTVRVCRCCQSLISESDISPFRLSNASLPGGLSPTQAACRGDNLTLNWAECWCWSPHFKSHIVNSSSLYSAVRLRW